MKTADLMSNTQKGTNYNLTDEEFTIISSSSPDVKLKFKILEYGK